MGVGRGRPQAHLLGLPCRQVRFPNCGKVMLREGLPRHQAVVAQRAERVEQGCHRVHSPRVRTPAG